ncbi:CbbQ/NirQ/NorQ/GpvN family protein [Acanthopleuribacter pedis]|uniref:CbbQ/NirQ/NorQ/GpvN family protein n=1 Tax=Acanthopleuribacter pedis TaxID=442870 RepID=A0A8J7U4Y6_9BACT|nr:CbbQ/NirQ/NorQ/GpvN family protein [Acanthopleuribacter pedis]MBO1318771.1 CbbQ/NirQ/NorQ/GpvN family protein [Acanthopleuribacter pedis]
MNANRTMTEIQLPWYRPVAQEVALFEACAEQQLPLLLKGPTGCGKSRFVEYMAARLGRELITVACHDDTTATDLLGRFLIRDGDTVWCDGPVTRAVRRGAVLYLDEIAEARPDVVVAVHPLTDHRRELYLDRCDEVVTATADFMLVASFNPFYQQGLKELKPSTRQRFVSLSFNYPTAAEEVEILMGETDCERAVARKLTALAGKLRNAELLGLAEIPSTRLLVDAARLIHAGFPPRDACRTAVIEPLTDDPPTVTAMCDLAALCF